MPSPRGSAWNAAVLAAPLHPAPSGIPRDACMNSLPIRYTMRIAHHLSTGANRGNVHKDDPTDTSHEEDFMTIMPESIIICLKQSFKILRRPHDMKSRCITFFFIFIVGMVCPSAALLTADAQTFAGGMSDGPLTEEERMQKLKVLFDDMSMVSGIPWYWFAAVNQYDYTMNKVIKSRKEINDRLLSIYYDERTWAGSLNPDPEDTNPESIRFFGGVGSDGDEDGRAERTNPVDVLYTLARHLLAYGKSPSQLKAALWEHYHNPRSVQRIEQFARLYETFGTLDLGKRAFPIPLNAEYTYRSTWGAARGWGGRRIHEGTDIFAPYGTPVRSTCYGVIEKMGWNKYGGWRIGIRDIHNVYHYFAHLSGFNKNLKEGDIVEPGETIGWVGSSGYGKPGTQGKFPPHLHYGMYRDNGLTEWSFDPYPYLRRWEKQEKTRRKPSSS